MSKWAQLRNEPPPTEPLRRGHWYPVDAIAIDGLVRVIGPGALSVPIHQKLIRLRDSAPDMVTRVQATEFQVIRPGQEPPMLSFYGVCPRDHRIDPLTIQDDTAYCTQCNLNYGVEDEHHV